MGGHDQAVSRRVASPHLVGRGAELESLDEALTRAELGEPTVVVIAGEAGIGKSRLATELAARAEARGFLVLTGGCIELCEGGVPFAPVVEALRRLRDQLGADAVENLLGTSVPELGALVPGLLGEAAASTAPLPPPGRLLELLLGLIGQLSASAPVLLIIEDLHWADRSTLDLVTFLERNVTGPVVMAGTVRSDELHRRHPLRPVLVELERSGSTVRVDLASFTRVELAEQVEAITGTALHTDALDDLLRRSQGNPFFAEELVAAGADRSGPLPDNLRDIVTGRFALLSDADQGVARLAAALGIRVDDRLLREVSALDDGALDESLRNLVDANLLEADPAEDGYCFRHALVQEAVYDELLPGERQRVHARIAETLAAERTGGAIAAAGLAHHWYRARNLPLALAAAVEAGLAAERVPAPAEAVRHYERALELWGAVPDAAQLSSLSHFELLAHAAEQEDRTGAFDRAVAHIRLALEQVDPATDPVQAGLLHERLGRFLWAADQDGLPDHEEALRLVPADPPSWERARVLAGYAQILLLTDHSGEVPPVAVEAVAIARAVGARQAEGHALNTLSTALVSMGQVDEGIAGLHESRVIAEALGEIDDIGRSYVNLTHALSGLGWWDQLVDDGLEGIARTRQLGLDRTHGAYIEANLLDGLVALGRWDEAEERLEGLLTRLPVGYWEHFGIGPVAPDRGHPDAIRALGPWLSDLPDGASVFQGLVEQFAAWVALAVWEQRADDARAAMALALKEIPEDFLRWGGGELLWRGIWAEADRAAGARARHEDGEAAEALSVAQGLLDRFVALIEHPDAWGVLASPKVVIYRRICEAELRRAEGTDDAAVWERAIVDLDAFPLVFPAAYARFRWAETLVRTGGDRVVAAEALAAAQSTAGHLGAVPFGALIESFGRRARLGRLEAEVSADDSPPAPGVEFGLSPREFEVLVLVAEGLTNRQIAETLYISPKTASVHVSNILAKLGVASRGEAAATAHRLGVVGP